MGVIVEYNLSNKDVMFLKTVRDIEQNPQDYDNTEPGETSANVTAIRKSSDLSKTEVDYRARSGGDSRGFGQEGMGLIVSHPPVMEDHSFGPRSVELTDKGYRVVGEIEQEEGSTDGGGSTVNDDRIDQLEESISTIENEIENISEVLEDYDESQMGAIDEQTANRLGLLLRVFPTHQFIFEHIFGTDPAELQQVGSEDTEAINEVRKEVFRTLASSTDAANRSSGDRSARSQSED